MSQTSQTVTVDPECPSSSPSDSCTVLISGARSLHLASQLCCLSYSPAFEIIMYHGRLGCFWILCHLIMRDYKNRYTNKCGPTKNKMNEVEHIRRTGSSTDKQTMHEKRCPCELKIYKDVFTNGWIRKNAQCAHRQMNELT